MFMRYLQSHSRGCMSAAVRSKATSSAERWNGIVIVGLGNPDKEHARTRHNLGFMVLDTFSERYGLSWTKIKSTKGLSCAAKMHDREVHLLKPMTYMNLSGDSLSPFLKVVRKHAQPLLVSPDNVLVIVDDLDQPFGAFRLKTSGSSGGHNGLKSIQQKLTTSAYPRLKIGIDRPPSGPVANYVLKPFSSTERSLLPLLLSNAADALEQIIKDDDYQVSMNAINPKDGRYQLKQP